MSSEKFFNVACAWMRTVFHAFRKHTTARKKNVWTQTSSCGLRTNLIFKEMVRVRERVKRKISRDNIFFFRITKL